MSVEDTCESVGAVQGASQHEPRVEGTGFSHSIHASHGSPRQPPLDTAGSKALPQAHFRTNAQRADVALTLDSSK